MNPCLKQLSVMIGLTIASTSSLHAQNHPDLNSIILIDSATNAIVRQAVRMAEVPKVVIDSAEKSVAGVRWQSTALLMTRRTGEPRSWYVLSAVEQVSAPVVTILADGDVEESGGIYRTIQVRLTSNGQVLDVAQQIDDKKIPAEVKKACVGASVGAEASAILEVHSADGKKLLGYRAIVESGPFSFTFHISTDGSQVERE